MGRSPQAAAEGNSPALPTRAKARPLPNSLGDAGSSPDRCGEQGTLVLQTPVPSAPLNGQAARRWLAGISRHRRLLPRKQQRWTKGHTIALQPVLTKEGAHSC